MKGIQFIVLGKKLEIKKDDFEMTTTMKIKRYKELQKDKS